MRRTDVNNKVKIYFRSSDIYILIIECCYFSIIYGQGFCHAFRMIFFSRFKTILNGHILYAQCENIHIMQNVNALMWAKFYVWKVCICVISSRTWLWPLPHLDPTQAKAGLSHSYKIFVFFIFRRDPLTVLNNTVVSFNLCFVFNLCFFHTDTRVSCKTLLSLQLFLVGTFLFIVLSYSLGKREW